MKIKVTDQEFPAQKETAKYLFRVAEGEMKDLRTDSTLFDYPIFISLLKMAPELLKLSQAFQMILLHIFDPCFAVKLPRNSFQISII